MKRKVAIIITVVFSLSLITPTVSAWDRDWNAPRYSTDASHNASTIEGHPWGELENVQSIGDSNYFKTNFILESMFYYIKFTLFNEDYLSFKIIVIQSKDNSIDKSNEEESYNIRQEDENTNNRNPYGG